jgi:hypothetical protein
MTLITLPDQARIKNVEWTLDRPAQVNRSDWTKRRQVVLQPGPSMWSATCDLVVRIGEPAMLEVEAFLVDLEGQVNSFQLPIADSPQLPAPQSVVVDGAGQSGRFLALRGGVHGQSLLRGHKITVNDQTVMLMAPLTFDATGKATATFKPSLRNSPADGDPVEVVKPYVLLSLTTSQVGWTVAPGRLYQAKQLVLEEAL